MVKLLVLLMTSAAGCQSQDQTDSIDSASHSKHQAQIDYGKAVTDPKKEGYEHLWRNVDDPELKMESDLKGELTLYWKKKENNQEVWAKVGEVRKIEKGRKFYRWTNSDFSSLVEHHGRIPENYLDMKVNEISQNYHGGGIYMSSNPFDSQSYGDHLSMMELEKDIFAVQSFDLQEFFDKSVLESGDQGITPTYSAFYNSVVRSLRMIGVHAIYSHSSKHFLGKTYRPHHSGKEKLYHSSVEQWFNFFHPIALTRLTTGSQIFGGHCDPAMIRFLRGEVVPSEVLTSPDCDVVGILEEILFLRNIDSKITQFEAVKNIAHHYPALLKEAFHRRLSKQNLSKKEEFIIMKKASILNIHSEHQSEGVHQERVPSSLQLKTQSKIQKKKL